MKKTRLLEIIKEEIALVLREGETEDKAAKSAQLKAIDLEIKALQKKKQDIMRSGVSEITLEEDLLNEAPIYDVSDMEGFKSTLNKFREEGISKSKALNLLLKKLEDEGTVDTNALSKEYNVDTATFNNQEIRKFLNRPEGEAFIDKKTGDELIDFTPLLNKSNKPKGKKASGTSEPKEKTALPDSGVKRPESKTEPKAAEPKAAEPKAIAKLKTPTKSDSEDKAMKSAERIDKGMKGKYATKLSDAEEKAFASYKKQASVLANKIEDAESPEDRARFVGQLKTLRNDPEVMTLFKAKGVSI